MLQEFSKFRTSLFGLKIGSFFLLLLSRDDEAFH